MKRHLGTVLLFLLLLSLLTALPALAKTETPVLWVSPHAEKDMAAIEWYKNGNEYYFFIPGNTDIADMVFGLDHADSAKVNGVEIRGGDSAGCLEYSNKNVVFIEGKRYAVTVMHGSAGLPAVYLTTESGSLDYIHKSKSNKEGGTVLFVNGSGETEYDGVLTSVKTRGNSSLTFKKKNYTLKLEKSTDLCGMGKSKTWIITGNYRDKSLLRNQITYDMAMYAGLEYTPEHITCEVYINNEYMGAYLFSEKVMISKSRIAIRDLEEETEALNGGDVSGFKRTGSATAQAGKFKAYQIPEEPEDITGGYLIEFESYSARYKQEASVYYTKKKNTLVIKSPEYCSQAQMAYITSFMQSFENAIFAKNGTDSKTGLHYSELVDMDSLVKKYLIEEVSKNYDGNSSSMFFYKPEDSISQKAFAGPVWDYDSAYASYARDDNAKKILTGKNFYINNAKSNLWWPALYKQADFKDAVIREYQSTFAPAMEILLGRRTDETGTLKSLDEYAEEIRASADMNFIRWPISANPSTAAKTGATFSLNITYLKNFIAERYDFLCGEWGK